MTSAELDTGSLLRDASKLSALPAKVRAKAETAVDLVCILGWTRGDGVTRIGLSRDPARDLMTAQSFHDAALFVALEWWVPTGHGKAIKTALTTLLRRKGAHVRGQHFTTTTDEMTRAVFAAAVPLGVTPVTGAVRLRRLVETAERQAKQARAA